MTEPTQHTAEELQAAAVRGHHAGKALAEAMMGGQADPNDLYKVVCQLWTSTPGTAEASGVLHVFASVLKAYRGLLQTTATNVASATARTVAKVTVDAIQDHLDEYLAAQRKYLEGIDTALRTVHAQLVELGGPGLVVPKLPELPPKPKHVEFEYNAAGEIVGATLH